MERDFGNEEDATVFAGDLSSRTLTDGFGDSSVDDDYELHHAAKTKAVPTSYLPSWVLKMREKIATSRTAHADAEQRISQLHMDVDTLSAKLLIMRPAPAALKVPKSGLGGASAKSEKKTERAYIYSLPSELLTVVLEYLQIRQIVGMDLVSRTFQSMISQCTYWSDAFHLYCPHLQVFASAHTSSELRCARMKSAMMEYLRNVKVCTDFIQTMKNQRSVPKHRSVQPHRHTRQERQVTHPMPVFEQLQPHTPQGGAQGGILQGSSWGQRADTLRSADRIMSHAETLSSDFRSVAHRALDTLSLLTADCLDPVIYKLVSDGAITVLTALLLNEEGAIQNYACVIIANLLCWEARKRALFRQQQRFRIATASAAKPSFSLAAIDAQTLLSLEVLFGLSARAAAQLVPLAAQVQACGGFKMMTSLLTSPTASINLASSSVSVYRGKGDGSSAGCESVGGTVKISTTSNIQGICNKQASRALLALLYPEMPIPAPAALLQRAKTPVGQRAFAMVGEAKSGDERLAADDYKSDAKAPSPTHVWRAEAKNVGGPTSGAVSPSSASPNRTKLAPLPHTGSPVKNSLPVSSTAPVPLLPLSHAAVSVSADLVPEQLRAPMVSPLFLSDAAARPWLFSYFYKSGAVKDQFTCYLRFVPLHAGAHSTSDTKASGMSSDDSLTFTGAELRGRGIDGIGAFALTGRAEADISGWTWYFHKSYVPTMFGTNNASGGEGGTALDWVRNVDDDVFSISAGGSGSTRGSTVHVSHVAYWSAGVDAHPPQKSKTSSASYSGAKAESKADADIGTAASTPPAGASADPLDFIDEEPSGVWGVGLWGVWETSSGTTPHFELQKGGVFRAAPIIL